MKKCSLQQSTVCIVERVLLVGWVPYFGPTWIIVQQFYPSKTGRQGGSTATAASPDVFLGAILFPYTNNCAGIMHFSCFLSLCHCIYNIHTYMLLNKWTMIAVSFVPRLGGWSDSFVSRCCVNYGECQKAQVSHDLLCEPTIASSNYSLGNWAPLDNVLLLYGPRWKGVWDAPSGISSINHFKTGFGIM